MSQLRSQSNRLLLVGLALGSVSVVLLGGSAQGATTIDGPIGLGTAAPFGVLAGSTVTNTNLTTITGDVGLSPGSSVTGFPPGIIVGTTSVSDGVAVQAKNDLTTAYTTAASLTPGTTGLTELAGLTLTPGVYSGGALLLSGDLTLAGTAESVWVFQAASTLTLAPGARVLLEDGASACNIFWQIGTSATLDAGAAFSGTIMADQSITAVTGATVEGRLLAKNAAVTLDNNTITTPTGCDAEGGTVTTSPTITSEAPPAATVGAAYSHTVTATGTPTIGYMVTAGSLPPGLVLDETTGAISGTPTIAGTYTFTVTADNGTAPTASADYSLIVSVPVSTTAGGASEATGAPTLPATGFDPPELVGSAFLLLLAGTALVVRRKHSA
ncbi:ice-binding family protein [Plantibacter sp. RU18]|uniref:ice-binding family protein n=1 Tax=Plantibacter sp. RU18 TaxID=3158143 RepID=UPI003D366958